MLSPFLKAAVLRAARDIRLIEFNFSQELLGENYLAELTDEELTWCEKHVAFGTKFSYELGLHSFTGERWKREREATEGLEALAAQALEETP
jgi:hypothetical protein